MALTWSLKLKDGMSGPAQKAGDSLDELAKRLKTVRAAIGEAAKKADFFVDKAGRLRHVSGRFASTAEKMAHGMGGASQQTNQLANSFKGLGKVASAAGGVIGVTLAASLSVMRGNVGVVQTLAGEIASFHEDMASRQFAFDRILGPGGAEKAMERIRAAASRTKTTISATAASFNQLMAAGFDLSSTDKLFKQLADLKAFNPAANVEGLASVIARIKNTGRLQGDEMERLVENGMAASDVYGELSKRLGKSVPDVIKLQSAGKISAGDALAAIDAALTKKGLGAGREGELAGMAPKKLADSWQMLKEQFMSTVNVDFGPAQRFLERLQTALDGEGGKALAAAFEDLFTAAGELADSFTVEDMIAGMKGFASVVKDVADGLRVLKRLHEGTKEVFGALGMDRSTLVEGGVKAPWEGAIGGLKGLGKAALGMFSAPLDLALLGWDLIGPISTKFMEAHAWVASQAGTWFASAVSLGTSLVDGIIAGLRQRWDALIADIGSLGSAARAAFGASIGEGSPAREFYAAGRAIPQGIAVGVGQGTGSARQAVADIVSPEMVRARASGQAIRQLVSNNVSNRNFTSGPVYVQAGEEQRGREIAAIVRREMRLASA